MISVAAALSELFALVAPLDHEMVPLVRAHGRILGKDVTAIRAQPPFAASAMDGYAIDGGETDQGTTFRVIGEAAAGHRFKGTVQAGEAVRIFTGAPLPDGTNHVVIQENVTRSRDMITITAGPNTDAYVRPAAADFNADYVLQAPRQLSPADIALLAAMNIDKVPVVRKPDVAIIATGDELVQPGETPDADQIIASNSYGLAALIDTLGGQARLLPIARDNAAALTLAFDLAKDADLIITIGGASVGDHDLVADVAKTQGLARSFYKVAMRPGKPLMAGKIGRSAMIGLPGNPVSAMVCGHVFVAPVLRKMLGCGETPAPRQTATLGHAIATNGPREHYMRARVQDGKVTVFERQDSALLSVLSQANCLAIRPKDDPARGAGDQIEIIRL